MTGAGNHTSFGGCGLFSGKLERGRGVTGESFNECQIILSATAALGEAESAARRQKDARTHTPVMTACLFLVVVSALCPVGAHPVHMAVLLLCFQLGKALVHPRLVLVRTDSCMGYSGMLQGLLCFMKKCISAG